MTLTMNHEFNILVFFVIMNRLLGKSKKEYLCKIFRFIRMQVNSLTVFFKRY